MVDNRTDDRDDESRGDRDSARAHDAGQSPGDVHYDEATGSLEYHEYQGATRGDAAHLGDQEAAGASAPQEAGVPAAASAEHERLVAERAARRETRLTALAPKPIPDPAAAYPRQVPESHGEAAGDVAVPETVQTETVTVTRRSTDQFAGSLGLFVLRLIVAAIVGVHGLNKLLNLPATTEMLEGTLLPAPGILAIVLGAAEVAIAIALVFGLLTRVAGLAVVIISGGALAFVLWGPWSPFQPGQAGFIGELEMLLVGAGLLFLLVGGGGWAVDRGFRARREGDGGPRS